MAKICLRDITKSFYFYYEKENRLVFSLKNINLHVNKGEIVGIIGANGSGKSSLLKILAGAYQPDSGKREIEGIISPIVTGADFFDYDLNLHDNLYLYLTLFSDSEIRSRIERILENSGLKDYIYFPLKYFSSGMLLRAAFTVATDLEFDFYLFDEIFQVGDAKFVDYCKNKLQQLQSQGKGIILVSHDVKFLEEFVDRVIVLNRGKIVFDGNAKEGIDYYLTGSEEGIFSLKKEKFQFSQYLYKMALLKEKEGKVKDAKKLIERIVRNYSDVTMKKYAAWFYKRQGDIERSSQLFEEVLEENPQDIEVRNEILNIYKIHKKGKLIDFLKKQLVDAPHDFHLQEAALFSSAPDLKRKAVIFFISSPQIEFYSGEIIKEILHYLEKERMLEEGFSFIEKLKKNSLWKDDVELWFLEAKLYYHDKNWKQALGILERLIALFPFYREAYLLQLAIVLEYKGDVEELEKLSLQAQENFKGIEEYLYGLRYYLIKRNKKGYLKLLEELNQLYPDFKNIWEFLKGGTE